MMHYELHNTNLHTYHDKRPREITNFKGWHILPFRRIIFQFKLTKAFQDDPLCARCPCQSYFNIYMVCKTYFSSFQGKPHKNTLSPHYKRLFFFKKFNHSYALSFTCIFLGDSKTLTLTYKRCFCQAHCNATVTDFVLICCSWATYIFCLHFFHSCIRLVGTKDPQL